MLKRLILRTAIYPLAIIGGTIAMVLIVAAFPWLPTAVFIAFFGLGILGLVVMFFVNLCRVISWL